MGALQYVDVPSYAGILFRRTYQDLALPGALMDRSKEWLHGTDARWNEREKTWTFPSGATVTFGYLEHDDDRYRYQSAEFQFIGFDELTQFSEKQYTYLFSRLRKTAGSPVPLRMCAASNPGGRGHGWVRRRLIEQPHESRVFIPARLDDNPFLDRETYVASLSHLSEILQQQLLEGLWNAFEGLAYPLFADDIHLVPAFAVPNWWGRFEAMDYGTQNPTSWGAFAADEEGNVLAFGLLHEPGYPSDTAPKIHERRARWWAKDEATGEPKRATCYAPSDIRTRFSKNTVTGKEISAETEFNDLDIFFAPAQQDRQAGHLRIAEMLKPDPERHFPDWHPKARQPGAPRLFIFQNDEMEPLIECLRDAPIEPDDSPMSKLPGEAVDEEWEHRTGHAHAMLRYALMSRPRASAAPKKQPLTTEELRTARQVERLKRKEQRSREDLLDV